MSVLTSQEYIGGKIPRLSDFEVALGSIISFYGSHKEDISFMMPYGSVVRKDHNIASDVDVLFISNSKETHKAFAKYIRDVTFPRTSVEIEVNPFHESLSQKGFHTLIPSFKQHLSIVRRNLNTSYGIDVLELGKKNSPEEVSKAAKEDLVYRISKFSKRYFYTTDKDRSKLLKQCLQEPYHILRAYLQYTDPTLFESESIDDSKKFLLATYNSRVNNIQDSEFFSRVAELKANYLQMLTDRTKDIVHDIEYEKLLNDIEDHYDEYGDFLERIATKLL